MEQRTPVELYDDPDRETSFYAGYVARFSEEYLLLRCLDNAGRPDGYLLLPKKEISWMSWETVYLKALTLPIEELTVEHPPVEDFDSCVDYAITTGEIVDLYDSRDNQFTVRILESCADWLQAEDIDHNVVSGKTLISKWNIKSIRFGKERHKMLTKANPA